jgi:serine/threonine protein kinase
MTFELGRTYGGYQFIDVMESSRTGVTYRVRNLAESRFEMLRLLPKTVQDDPERVERFFREAKLRGRLSHQNIVSFYKATSVEGQFVMTTEAIEGRTLAERLELGAMPAENAAEIGIQLLRALQYAHQHGVVHRCVSPGNILLTPEGVLKLSGFSFARAASDPRLTQMGAALGEVHYMSPEQVRGVDDPDTRSDLYSAGVVVYEMLTGKRPFEAASQFDIMLAHVNTAPKPPSHINGAIPAEIDTVVLYALAKDPARRFQTALEFCEALQVPALIAPPPVEIAPIAFEPPPPFHAQPFNQPDPFQTVPLPSPAAREAALDSPRYAPAGPASPATGMPEIRIGPQEVVVLALGVFAMVLFVVLLAR